MVRLSGVELIVTALAAGAAAGVTNTTSGAIGDAYRGLRALLSRRLSGRWADMETLDAGQTEPGVWQARLGEELSKVGAAGDEEVLAAASRLLALLDVRSAEAGKYGIDLRDARGVQAGDHNIQTNTFS